MEHLQALAAAELGSSSTTAVRERTHGSVYVLREDVAVSEGSFLHGQEASARSPPREEASSSVPLESKGRADSPPCPAPLSPPFVVHHYPPAGSTHQPLPLATSAAAGRHSALLPQPPPSLRSFMMNNAGAAPNNTFVGGPLISPRGSSFFDDKLQRNDRKPGRPPSPLPALCECKPRRLAAHAAQQLWHHYHYSIYPKRRCQPTSLSAGEQNKRRLPSVQAPASSPLPKKARLSEKSAKQPRKSSKLNGTVQLLRSFSSYFYS
ncbi:uncharacterized protein ACA1_181620 [Acanthamoeba castellanii str. Neff]|uniref:Uncharacterized protein n=1 Tax=Acanthamoeba castellanii (strain ATCC 30010 / Neff) TaxID=1257118 RepID=L8H962_ACACF|nr:uncharacterized protein ACA1_181620 [Acanthamoeba castellanii str. Neff]ELR21273.1 hypothetical protein ACA1_181620 [Acanthamoeba castellanii str. Neff]